MAREALKTLACRTAAASAGGALMRGHGMRGELSASGNTIAQ